MFENIKKELSKKVKENKLKLQDILNELFKNEEISSFFPSEIRRSTTIGIIANEIGKENKLKEKCKIMAIGDIKYFEKHRKRWNKIVKKSLNNIKIENLYSYDIESNGSKELRKSLFSYINNYYNLKKFEKKDIINSIIPTYGATDAFSSLIYTLKKNNSKVKLIYPEASFLSNISIAEDILGKTNTVKINKANIRNFFFSEKQIIELYKNKIKTTNKNIYYITPVGNPTGVKIAKTTLERTIKTIHRIDKEAIFILDNVYVGLLKKEDSYSLFENIFNNQNLMNQIIFTESLSKTLGMTGVRIAWIWTTNSNLSLEIQKNISMKKAGFSKILNEFTINLLKNNKKILKFQNDVYDFWSKQRKNFYKYVNDNFSELFDLNGSCKFNDREGIYLLLKVKTGLSKEFIYYKTNTIGVSVELSDGFYIRYSFGNINYF